MIYLFGDGHRIKSATISCYCSHRATPHWVWHWRKQLRAMTRLTFLTFVCQHDASISQAIATNVYFEGKTDTFCHWTERDAGKVREEREEREERCNQMIFIIKMDFNAFHICRLSKTSAAGKSGAVSYIIWSNIQIRQQQTGTKCNSQLKRNRIVSHSKNKNEFKEEQKKSRPTRETLASKKKRKINDRKNRRNEEREKTQNIRNDGSEHETTKKTGLQ